MNYTPQQQQAIVSEARFICVDAGAGSGKTRVLVDRIVHLLRTGKATLEEIVAITFTEKAALEMKDRLRRAFRKAAPKDDPAQFGFWRDLERRVDTAHITTIHAFCSRLLRDNALHLDLDPDFGMVSDAENAVLMEEAIDGALMEKLQRRDPAILRLASEFSLKELHGLCRKLILERGVVERVRSLAPAETPEELEAAWSAAAEAERLRYFAAQGANAAMNDYRLALLRYENMCDDSAESREYCRVKMLEAIKALQEGSVEDVPALLRDMIEKPAKRANAKPWCSREAFDAVDKDLKKVREFVEGLLEVGELAPELAARAAQLTTDLLALEEAVNRDYSKAKSAASLLDFDDLILKALHVLRENNTLRSRTAGRIKYLLLDEFQDTDGQQLEIARLLHGESSGPALFIVGDPKQSIYYFRGAEVEIFQSERAAADELVKLDRNFRSLPGVLDFVNDFFTRSNLLCAVERYHPMAIQRPADRAARVGFIVSDPPKGTNPKKWLMEEYRAEEATQVAAQIARLCSPDSAATVVDEHTNVERPPTYGDVALLFRRTTSIGTYEEALRKAGIPYVVLAGAGFYERQEVVDVINVLKILADPWDEPALLAYLRGPAVALSDDDIVRMCERGALAEVALGDSMPTGLDHPERLERGRDHYRELRARAEEPLEDLVDHVLAVTGIEPVLLSQYQGVQKASNLRKFAALAREQARRGGLSLREFVTYLDGVRTREIREGDAGLQPDGSGAVTLMTIHKSKGLEFPIVFIPDTAGVPRGSNPGALHLHRKLGIAIRPAAEDGERRDTALGQWIKRRTKEEEGAESARVLYVALTRARDMLYICGRPDAPLGTWFHAIDAVYRVTDLGNGGERGGKLWNGRVVRGLAEAPSASRARGASTDLNLDVVRRRIAPVTIEPRGLPSISVSKLLLLMVPGDAEPEEARYERTRDQEEYRQFALDRGTLVHRMFEWWNFATDGPDLRTLVRAAGLGLGRRVTMEEELANIRDWFSKSPLGKRLAGETGLMREHPFSLRIGDTIVNGTIDLALSDGTVIDYKTGKIKAESGARYEKQLLLYAAALRDLAGITPKEGFLVYVDAHEVKPVEFTDARIQATLMEAGDALATNFQARA